VAVLVGVAVWWALAFLLQRSVLFPRSMIATPPAPDLARLDAEPVWLVAAGVRSEAWWLPARSGAKEGPVLLFAHGNAELIDHWGAAFEPVRERGASVLLVEFPGYGRSEGAPSESSIRGAMVEAFDWAVARGHAPERIVGWGRSLGGGALCTLARERPLAALVLESTFASVRSLAARLGVPGFLVRDPFDNVSLVASFPRPLLLLHGDHDEVVPPAQARELSAAAPRAELVWMPCGHNDCPRPFGPVLEFLGVNGLLR